MLDQSSSQPLYQQLAARIRESIVGGELKPGDRIRSELELARVFGISPMTARHALEELETEGAVYRQQGKGTYVAGPFATHQGFIVGSFAKVAAERGWTVEVECLQQGCAPVPAAAARDLGLEPGSEAVCIRRLRRVSGLPMMVETSWLPGPYKAVAAADLKARPLHKVIEEVGHLELVRSDDFIWAGEVSVEDATLLGVTPGEPTFVVHGVIWAEGGVPVRSTDVVLNGRHFRFSLAAGGGLQMLSPTASHDDASAEWVALRRGY
jgi:GntR family transcriptional regulator